MDTHRSSRRLQTLHSQLLPGEQYGQLRMLPTGASQAPEQRPNAALNTKNQEQAMKFLKVIMEYRESGDKLMEDGTLPNMSMFDVLLATNNEMGAVSKADAGRWFDEAEAEGRMKVLDLLPGPRQACRDRAQIVRLLQEHQRAQVSGRDIFQYAQWQLDFGGSLTSNIAVPKVQAEGSGSKTVMKVIARVIIGDPQDAERLARMHVRKEGNFESILYDSVISTTDNESWKAQRRHLSEVFLPLSSLAKIMPVSLSRAKQCAQRLAQESAPVSAGGPNQVMDLSDFLLHEAQAQLQLALLGAPEDLMEATNVEIRNAFMGDPSRGRVGALGEAMKTLMNRAKEDTSLSMPSDGCPVRGPLSRAVQDSGLPPSTDYGNMLLILFAGHDTTGHTMTWLLFELARHPDIQKALHIEVDAFFQALGGRDPDYRDLGAGLDLLDRCITETLRMWPAVASGTYRQLQFDDTVKGAGGAMVRLPKGTPVHIVNWSRHRAPELWGPDADDFNPYRDFKNEEMARVGCPMAGITPQSERFSPFAHAPRSCLGRNFAQMEMRLIMLYLLRDFDFQLAEPYTSLMGVKLGATPGMDEFHGINRATMGPKDPQQSTPQSWGDRFSYAMRLLPVSRPHA